MVSAQVNDLTAKIKNLEEENGRLIEKNMRLKEQLIPYRNQQSIVASAPAVGSCNGEPDITQLSIEESVVERYHQLKNAYDFLKQKHKNVIKLNLVLMREKEELKMELEDYRSQDSEDGKKNVTVEHENPINQVSVQNNT